MLPTAIRLSRATTIGWIGLGAMGHPMAINLFTKTYLAHVSASSSNRSSTPPSFLVCEQDDRRTAAFLDELRQKGGAELAGRVERSGNGKQVGISAARIFTMLPSTPQVEAVYLDASSGILAGIDQISSGLPPLSTNEKVADANTVGSVSTGSVPPHTLLIDHTTLDPTAAKAVAEAVQKQTEGRVVMMDAPVSGGIVAAAAGALSIMFGSPSPVATALATPFLQRMAREGGVTDCGFNGAGVGVKVCNNLILAINQIALAEGLALGKSLGIDPILLHNVINTSSGQSWSSRVNSPLAEVASSPGSRGFSGGFQSRLMLKDAGLALTAAHKHDLPTPLTWAAKSVYDAVCEEKDGEWASKDFSVVFEWLKKKQEEGVERGWKPTEP